ncbi:MAG: helix-turn-helix domain-containing protein [Notoacmeibacter sp.]|nr:helix-turn-helix domain-containing protein [Notoacmeibacter sp.]
MRGTGPVKQPIQRYYLYGDQHSDVDLDFLHVEPIRDRSGAHDWIIRPHAHPDHVQILFIAQGGGWLRVEDREFDIPTPSLMVIPSAMVHEIRFEPGTDGHVITAAVGYVNFVAHGDSRLVDAVMYPGTYALSGTDVWAEGVRDAFDWMHREFVWSAPGRKPAIIAQMLRILVALLRLRSENAARSQQAGADRDYALFSRYRELLEQNFRTEKGMEYYAASLGVTPPRLNAACKAKAGRTASEMLHERLVIEAKRYLLYTEMTVAEIGHDIGFDDPAYFSRFFSRRAGEAPGAYRMSARKQRSGG